MRHALELGINLIDTAAVYGLGHSEEVVGRLLRDLSPTERPLVFTKCGLVWSARDRMDDPERVLRPESIRREAEASLRRLGVERIDLYQFHWPDDTGTAVEDSWGEMTRLVEAGKVRAAGVSNFDVGLLERCEALRHVDSLQHPFSLIRREAAAAEIPWCAAHGTGVIVYSPMQTGILTDVFTAQRVAKLAPDDWRRRAAEFQQPNLARNLALRDALKPVARRHSTTVSAVAVAWTLAWPGVTGAIVGARSPEQIDGWIGAAGLALSPADLDEIAAAIAKSGAGAGPVRPAAGRTGAPRERAPDARDARRRAQRPRDHARPGGAREARSRPVSRGGRAAGGGRGGLGRRGRQRVGPAGGAPRPGARRGAPLGRLRRGGAGARRRVPRVPGPRRPAATPRRGGRAAGEIDPHRRLRLPLGCASLGHYPLKPRVAAQRIE